MVDVKIGQYSSVDCDQGMICVMVFLWTKISSTQFVRLFKCCFDVFLTVHRSTHLQITNLMHNSFIRPAYFVIPDGCVVLIQF